MRVGDKLVDTETIIDIWKLFAETTRNVSKADDIDFILWTIILTADLMSIEIDGFTHFWIRNITVFHYFYYY
jgi:hypothetical protein